MPAAPLEILIPYFGDRAPLEEAVTSVLGQTRTDWRLIVVEDGDQRQDAAHWLASLDDPRVRHVLNPTRLGVAGNFQRCLDLAQAELITFMGCDDRLLPRYVERAVEVMEARPGAAAVLPGVDIIDEDGAASATLTDRVKSWLRPDDGQVLAGEAMLARLCDGNWTYFPATCWRRSAVATHGFRQDMRVALDLDLLASLVLDGHQFVVLREPLFEYRRHSASVSSATRHDDTRFEEERRLHAELRAKAAHRGWGKASRRAALRLTSRLHAAALLPHAAARPGMLRALLRHVLGP